MALKNLNVTGHKAYLVIFAGLVIVLTATTTQAGFEWVPATTETPAAAAEQQPNPEATDITAAEEGSIFTPAPVVQTEALQPQQLSEDQDLTEPPSTPQSTVQNLADQAPAQVQPVKRQQIIVSEEAPKLKTLTSDEVTPEQAPQALVPVETSVAPAPTFKVIMPEDAPDSAMASTPGGQKILVNPDASNQSPAVDGQPYAVQQAAPVVQPAAPVAFSEAVGFGSDMPLAMALQQVVPAEYAFAFGPDVNAGSRVSWNGGKPWNEVVSEMASSLGLRADIRGRVVHINQPTAPVAGKSAAAEIPADLIDTPPIDLTASSASTDISNNTRIKDPGETPSAQPSALLAPVADTIKTSATEQQLEAIEAPQDIAPASGEEMAAPQEKQTEAPPQNILDPAAAPEEEAALEATSEKLALAAAQAADKETLESAKGFQARRGDSLKDTLSAWSSQAGVELLWQSSHDYTIGVDISTDSSFENAVQTVFSNALNSEDKPSLVFLSDTQTQEIKAVMIKEEAAAPQKG